MASFSSQSGPIDVVLADPNPLILSALSEQFTRDPRFSLVATLATAEDFLSTTMRLSVRVGVIDWNLPLLGGQRVIEFLREQENAPRVVVYSDADRRDIPRRALTAGAAGFCPRSGTVQELLNTVAEVAAGKMVFPFLDVRELQADPIFQLTKRERALLDALAEGRTNKELAESFGISVNTVKFHLSNLYEKLDVKNRSQAIAFYFSARIDSRRSGGDNE
ncbi:MAG: response regulator transcription factor [Rhodobacteraceae bacterium]|nr:response regulator transcription factor [Paracoccaceae bacterium]